MSTTLDHHRRLLTSTARLQYTLEHRQEQPVRVIHCVCKLSRRWTQPARYGYRGYVIVENGSAWDEGERGRARRYSYGLEGERAGEAQTIEAAKTAIDALI